MEYLCIFGVGIVLNEFMVVKQRYVFVMFVCVWDQFFYEGGVVCQWDLRYVVCVWFGCFCFWEDLVVQVVDEYVLVVGIWSSGVVLLVL